VECRKYKSVCPLYVLLGPTGVIAPTIVGKLYQKEQLRRKHVHKYSSIIGASDLTFALIFRHASTNLSVTTLTGALDGRLAPSVVATGWPRKEGSIGCDRFVRCVRQSRVEYDPLTRLPKALVAAPYRGYFTRYLILGARCLFASSF
jgi:hypothetical protein